MNKKNQIIDSDGKSSMTEEELKEWAEWAEKWVDADPDALYSAQDLKAKR